MRISKRINKYKKCKFCNKNFKPWRKKTKYCCNSCFWKDLWKNNLIETAHRKTGSNKTCPTCGKIFYVIKSHIKKDNYCSQSCHAKTRLAEKNSNWRGGKDSKRYYSKILIRNLKLERNQCELCGSIDFLEAHHKIQYSKKPELVNDPNNIEILCIDCHMKKHPRMKKVFEKRKIKLKIIKQRMDKKNG